MKTLIIILALILTTLSGFSQYLCATSFKRNNGNGTCSSMGQLRLTFPGGCPVDVPMIDSLYVNGKKYNVTFAAPDLTYCGGTGGYIGYCVTSGNMPPVDVWKMFFRNKAGVAYSCDLLDAWINILPIKFVSFDASLAGNAVTCNWATEEEINSDHFELERSFDGINFSTIGFVMRSTSHTERNLYNYTDKSASLQNRNIIYYRVKHFDNNRKIAYSRTITVKPGSDNSKSFQVSPNQFADNLAIKFEATENGTAVIRIISFTGQPVITRNAIANKGINNVTIGNLSGLVKGVYVAQVSINGVIVGNQKIVKN